jgi:hypothetical protein
MGAAHSHRVHPQASMFGGPEAMDDGMQIPPVGKMHPDMIPRPGCWNTSWHD